jgi:hypothetical protein
MVSKPVNHREEGDLISVVFREFEDEPNERNEETPETWFSGQNLMIVKNDKFTRINFGLYIDKIEMTEEMKNAAFFLRNFLSSEMFTKLYPFFVTKTEIEMIFGIKSVYMQFNLDCKAQAKEKVVHILIALKKMIKLVASNYASPNVYQVFNKRWE